MKTLNRIYLTLAIVFAIVGAVQCVRWSFFGAVTVGYLLNFVPATAFLLAYVAGRKVPRKRTHVGAVLLCLVCLLGWGFVSVAVELLVRAVAEVTDIGRYEEILSDRWYYGEKLVSHFPRPIPSDAQEVKLSFRPAFLQGGAHIQLR